MKPKQGQWHLLTGTILGHRPWSGIFTLDLTGSIH